ncbi:MAG: ribosomal protein S18-alanine N-acetyltransferase [Candidatus Cloacimonetes bacterium]|nr:ribosomal protein S18-alanine N-acetyltransferase [Candidatus Cloacimonadota bacterium]
MNQEDLSLVLEIEKVLFTSPWNQEMFLQEIELHDSYVMEIEEVVAGYICGWEVGEEFHITNIGVKQSFQRKGFASQLLFELISSKMEKGFRYFFLEVRESNFKAIHLYHKFGFETIGKRKRYYNYPVEDALIMGLFPYGKPDYI